ncbi:hypothetical protein XMV225_001875 [Aliiroseovarius sp. xm-v-225]|uniref:YfjI family protein n=1 Tax=unclassified Aliiroseovarius TaxID=2623558 RepID=UPI00156905E1|nr:MULTISPECIES: YfjI family protein [unclassified Aliiroseovarius]NRP44708.1 hypothetical protein [Aliiroseovarius sp. xm-m-378]NRP65579.1 hypothetical protein [Aliiroseovarius sp. xm-v-225]NRP92640.1 hypothetical protein [Aliiroseovarius sp. xm-a-134]
MNAVTPTPFKADGPQPLVRTIAQGAPYPIHALGPLREAVEAVQGQSQAPVGIAAQSALSVASLAVQGFADVETLGGDRAISLYCLTIALSGERKSSCDKPLMNAVRIFEQEQADAQRHEMDHWKNAHDVWEAKRKKCILDAGKGKEKGAAAQADLNALGAEPTPPPSKDRTVSEPTYEGLVRKLAEGQPSLGLFSDEGGQFLGGFAMTKDQRLKTLAAFNDLWQGNPIQRTRAGEGSLVLYGRRLAIHLMAQPAVLRDFMADSMTAETGFLPRFLITEPPSTIGTRLHEKTRTNPAALGAFSKRLTAILETAMPMDEHTRALSPRVLPLSSQAREVLIQFSDMVETAMGNGGKYEGVTGYASKAAEQAARIAAVLTLWPDLEAKQVEAATMAHAVDLAEFYLNEALRLKDAAIVTAETTKAESLRVWLLDKWTNNEIMPSEVVQYGPNHLRELKAVKSAIKTLADAGWLVPLESGAMIRGSARKEAYRIVKPIV